jgi:signal peptidase I
MAAGPMCSFTNCLPPTVYCFSDLTGVRLVLYDAVGMSNDTKSSVIEESAVAAGSSNGAGAQDARGAAERKAAEKQTDEAAPKTQGPPRTVWREYFESLVVTAIMAFFGMTFVVQAVKVPTGSMQNTILIGDHLLVNKFIFAPGEVKLPFLPQREIRRGDIIVFKYPGSQTSHQDNPNDPTNKQYITNYVKRVVGTPGDRIEIRSTRVFVNGEQLPEHIVSTNVVHDDDSRTPGLDQNAPLVPLPQPPPEGDGPYTVFYDADTRLNPDPDRPYPVYEITGGRAISVPEGHYFVMGDSRDNSLDSRWWGFVPRDLIIGRAMFVYWSYDETQPMQPPFILDFFRYTRWSRTGTMVK